MAVIGSLLVNVKANSAGFTSGIAAMRSSFVSLRNDITGGFAGGAFNGASNAIGGLFTKLGQLGSKVPYVGQAFNALGSTLGSVFATFAPHIQMAADHYDALGKLSDRLGIGQQSLIGLGHSANLAGVSQEQLTGGLEKFLSTLGNAQAGIGDAGAKLRALGLDINSLSGMAPETALGAVFDRINELDNVAARASMTVAIFGKAGQALAPMIAEGSAGMRLATAEANALGMGLTRIETAKIEAANDAMSKLAGVMRGFFGKMAAEMSPFITGAIDGILDVVKHFGGLGEIARTLVSTFKWVAVSVVGAFDIMTTPIRIAITWVDALKENFAEVGKMMSELWDNFKTFAKGVLAAMPALEKFMPAGMMELLNGEGIGNALGKAFTPNALKLHDWFGEVEAKAAAMGEAVEERARKRRGVFGDFDDEDGKKSKGESRNLGAAIKGSVEAFKAIAEAERRGRENEAGAKGFDRVAENQQEQTGFLKSAVDILGKVQAGLENVAAVQF